MKIEKGIKVLSVIILFFGIISAIICACTITYTKKYSAEMLHELEYTSFNVSTQTLSSLDEDIANSDDYTPKASDKGVMVEYDYKFNIRGFVVTISLLFGSVLLYYVLQVLANISISLKEINKKIEK
ncbi:MAG: hypothetical protein HUK18_04070 [Bacteroidales bacterium]|nr:hypothetical protein [Bacteroidales bacterium]